MKKLYYLPIALLMATTNIGHADAQASTKGLNFANLDTTADPGADFFRFATGGWSDANPIPDEFSRYGSFDQLRDNNQKQIKDLIEELGETKHLPNTNGQKIGDLYRIGMDSVKLNTEKAAPLKSHLEAINGAESTADIIRLTAIINRFSASPFFGIYIGADDMNSSMNIVHLYQSGLGMGNRDYYLNDDSKELRAGYANLINTQFLNAGYSEVEARLAAAVVLQIETKLAEAHYSKEKMRIPEENYNKIRVAELYTQVGSFDWSTYFKAAGVLGITDLNVSQLEAISTAVKLIQDTPVNDLKLYLAWKVIASAAPYLSDEFVDANFDFFGKQMSGRKVNQPRWKRTVAAVEGALGEEVGQIYVAKHFPAKAKERMLKLVKNLEVSLSERINNLDWMGSATKAKAQEKLGTFIVKVGYPDKWRDASALEIKDDSYLDNVIRGHEFEYKFMLSKLGTPVDVTEWHMTPQTVNAYYNPTTNEICFPAGILQPPFFYMDADDAVNYGAIGVVIGHEMTHGFDDQGRKFDKNGNLSEWWTAEDAAKFDERAKVMVDYFDNIVVVDSLHANGTFTLGENIADHGGIQVSYNAYLKTKEGKANKVSDGFSAQQRFFLAYSNLWAGNIRKEEIIRLTKIDPHSLGRWRVNGALPHIDAWYKLFNITEKDSMYLPKEKRVSIW